MSKTLIPTKCTVVKNACVNALHNADIMKNRHRNKQIESWMSTGKPIWYFLWLIRGRKYTRNEAEKIVDAEPESMVDYYRHWKIRYSDIESHAVKLAKSLEVCREENVLLDENDAIFVASHTELQQEDDDEKR